MQQVYSKLPLLFLAIIITSTSLAGCKKKDMSLKLNEPRNIKGVISYRRTFGDLNEAARILFDYTDFTSFSKLHTDVKTNNCRIMHAAWTQVDDVTWVFTIQADRFLRNMVRAVVGTLLEVGRGKLTVEGFRRVIEQKDRCKAGTSVPGNALFLVDVTYPEELFIADNN